LKRIRAANEARCLASAPDVQRVRRGFVLAWFSERPSISDRQEDFRVANAQRDTRKMKNEPTEPHQTRSAPMRV